MHAQSTGKVTFHHPEGFCQKQGVGNFLSYAVNYVSPEFRGDCLFKFIRGQGIFSAGRNVTATSGLRIPQAADVFFCQNHCRVKADNREVSGNMQNFLHDFLAGGRVQKVNLCRVVPWHTRSVVSVVDVAGVSCRIVYALEYNGTV